MVNPMDLTGKRVLVTGGMGREASVQHSRHRSHAAAEDDEEGRYRPGDSNRNHLGANMPDDVANAIAFLLSPVSRHITGVMLPVDAGYTSC